MEDLEQEIWRLIKFADGVEFHRQMSVWGKHTDEINKWAEYRREQIKRHIRDLIYRYTNNLKLENQIYKEVNESNSKYVKLRTIIVLMIWICVWFLLSYLIW